MNAAVVRRVAVAATVFGGLVPVAALAGFPGSFQNDYEADVERDPNANLGFDRANENGTRVVERFEVGGVHLSCTDGFGSTERVSVPFEDGQIPLAGGRFDGRVRHITMTRTYTLLVEGELRSGGRAKGTLSLRAKEDPDVRCYSGILRFRDDGS